MPAAAARGAGEPIGAHAQQRRARAPEPFRLRFSFPFSAEKKFVRQTKGLHEKYSFFLFQLLHPQVENKVIGYYR